MTGRHPFSKLRRELLVSQIIKALRAGDRESYIRDDGDNRYRIDGRFDLEKVVDSLVDRLSGPSLSESIASAADGAHKAGVMDDNTHRSFRKYMLKELIAQCDPDAPINPNAETIAAMEEARVGGGESFETISDLMADLTDDEKEAKIAAVEVALRRRLNEQMEKSKAEYEALRSEPLKPITENLHRRFDRIEAKLDRLIALGEMAEQIKRRGS